MLVAALVVALGTRGGRLVHILCAHRNGTVALAPVARVRKLAGELEGGEGASGVAARKQAHARQGLVVKRVLARKAIRACQGVTADGGDVLVGEAVELDHARARQKRLVHLEERVLRGGTHKHDDAVLHGVEQGVLLAAVEAVDLVDEQDGAPAVDDQAALCRVDLLAQVLHRAGDSRHLHELGARGVGDDAGQGGLACAGRAKEDDRAQRVVLDGAAQPRPGAHGAVLPAILVERLGAHAHRQGRIGVDATLLVCCKQCLHVPGVPWSNHRVVRKRYKSLK